MTYKELVVKASTKAGADQEVVGYVIHTFDLHYPGFLDLEVIPQAHGRENPEQVVERMVAQIIDNVRDMTNNPEQAKRVNQEVTETLKDRQRQN